MKVANVVILLLALAHTAGAQVTTGSISGTVKDAQGGAIPGATVILVSDTRGTKSVPVVSNGAGDFVFPNVTADKYTVQIEMPSFKTTKRAGVVVNAQSRISLGTITLDVGGTAEVVDVKAEAPLIQATSGERSYTVATESVENLPIANRSFTALASLAPGVTGTTRIGGGGQTNVMMDGVSTLDTGSNAILLQMTVESIAEVKVLTSNYQAEYGRSSGLQVTAVTKSGTNRFRGSLYDVERNSDWNANSRTNILNGDPKPITRERDWGYSIGGPVGKPGGNNKLFFFYSQEYAPRTAGNNVVRFRMPTTLERKGDFSQTTDQNGNLFPYIYDSQSGLPVSSCATTVTGVHTACFADGGVLGRIPAGRLYQTGLNILNLYPLPNIANVPGGQAYNYQLTRPSETALAWEPAVRLDYQASQALRTSFKYSGWAQRNQVFNGSIPGFNDAQMQHPVVSTFAVTANYSLNPTTFLEGTYGKSKNELAGCALAQGGTGPSFCTGAIPVGVTANLNNVGLSALPQLFPNASVIDPRYYTYDALQMISSPVFQNGRVVKPPTFTWGNRVANAPPSIGWPGFLNANISHDVSISLTKVAGNHTIKSGFYNTYAWKAVALNPTAFGSITFSNDTSNPLDSQFGFANAALGVFSAYNQSSSFAETASVYTNTEGYLQDNWKIGRRLTLDFGVRLIHQVPQHDSLEQASNFLPNKWAPGAAPALYSAGCPGGVNPCSAANRQAINPITGQSLGAGSSLAIGTLVPGTGSATNGLFRQGQGIAETNFVWPTFVAAPRFGFAYDLAGNQKMVIRGGAGLFFDRPNGSTVVNSVSNPPTSRNVTVRYGQLQTLGQGGLSSEGAPALLGLWDYAPGGLPASAQWNAGLQMALPWSSSVDVSYVAQHSWDTVQQVNLNGVDFGTAFRPEYQDPTLAASTTPGATAMSTDLLRAYRGFGAMTAQWQTGWRTFHSIQVSLSRRFTHGLSFGFNDTWTLYDHQSTTPRLQHASGGDVSQRADQAQADALLGEDIDQVHILKGNAVWDLPDIKSSEKALRVISYVVNDWQLSAVWSGATGSSYAAGFTYSSGGGNVNLTGSPDYSARARVVGDTGSGCSNDVYRQFNAAAIQGPLTNSVGLESGGGYLRGCFTSVLDLAIARTVRLGGKRTLQLRLDMFNAPNQAIITGRNSTINLTSPGDPVTASNLPFDAAGNLVVARSLPRGGGFGVATAYQAARSLQGQVRFAF
ncbi:MAG: carboxypeptidase-like regulatory domain-containing protein [Vicinamibacterales bacterium]